MLRADEAVAQAPGVPDRELDDAPGADGKALRRRRRLAPAKGFRGAAGQGGVRQAVLLQNAGALAAVLPEDAEQKVLAADIAVAQLTGGLLRFFDGGLRPVGESVVYVHLSASFLSDILA